MPAPLQNDTFLRALRREPTPYTPIWLMRQAGRYLPEYNATRARAGNFLNLCKTPEQATEVTLQPLERFALDAAILFSDILTIPDAMGLGLHFVEGEGPRFKYPLRTEQDILRLAPPDPTVELRYVLDAVRSIRHALAGRVPLIGFSGSPFTLACYMVEGGGSDDYRHLRTLLYKRPDLMHHLLEVNRKAVSAYLAAQVEAGAQVLMIFDTWGGMLTPGNYRAFSLAYMAGVIADLAPLTDGVPVIVFTKGGGLWLEAIAQCGSDAVGLDWTIEIADAKRRVGDRVALQGNLDPFVLLADGNAAVSQARQILDGFGADPGHIFNLGHGISQYTPPEHVSMLVEEVHNYSRRSRENQAGS